MQNQIEIKTEVLKAGNNVSLDKINLKGDLNFNNYQDFVSVLNELKEKGVKKIVIDFEHLTRIDSTGIGTLINNAKKLEKDNGELIIVRCSEQVMTLLKPIKLDTIIKIYKGLDEGINYLAGV